MMERIESDGAPNLLALEYSDKSWTVKNLFLIPSFAFSPTIIEKRKPLGPNAVRKGWVGCNFLIGRIPQEDSNKLCPRWQSHTPHGSPR